MITTNLLPLAFLGGIGSVEMLVFGVIAVLLFGRNLPSVARSAGKSLTEFKKGLQELQDEVKISIDTDTSVVSSNRSKSVGSSLNDDTSDSDTNANESTEENSDDDSSEEEEFHKEGYPSVRSADSGMSDDSQY